MGCDIHIYLEKQMFSYNDKEKQNGVWVNADMWSRDGYYEVYMETEYDETNDDEKEYSDVPEHMRGWEIKYDDRIYSGRNYNLFAMLANVRNGHGFAGFPTGKGFVPISMPKGLPDNVSAQVRMVSDAYGIDGHSHSWLTLKELLDYDWEGQGTVSYGVVDENGYKVFKEKGAPDSWCAMRTGNGLIDTDNDTMDRIISGEQKRDTFKNDDGEETSAQYLTRVEWEEKYADCCRFFLDNTIPKLKSMVREFADEKGKHSMLSGKMVDRPEDLRIVFFFDN